MRRNRTIWAGLFLMATAALIVTGGCENRPPDAPFLLGPAEGKVGEGLSFSLSSVDPDRDPLKTAINDTIFAADTMTNSTATNETLYITASGLTVGQRYTLRLFAQNASGTVTWYGRDIAEANVGLLSSKSGNFLYMFR